MLNKKALAATSGVSQYQIERSLRFNSADSAYLTRTPASAGNRKTWTMSLWVKRCALSTTFEPLISNLDSSALNGLYFFFTSADKLKLGDYGSSSYSWEIETTQVFRDTSAWYHIVVALDTTQATASNRFKLYVNGSQVTAFGTANYPTQNSDGLFNNTPLIAIGRLGQYTSYHASYYMTEVNFIDGQALAASSFGETDADTGIWKPKAFSGTYGTNGFYLDFSDNSGTTSTTLGKDYSGNSNNFTPNNFSVTAGTGNDSLVDTPTPYGTDTGAGGEVRGNYGTWNPLWTHSSITLANGNLQATGASSSDGLATGTIAISSGKWYWESTVLGGSSMWAAGIVKTTVATPNYSSLTTDSSYAWNDTGTKYNGQTGSSYGASSYTTNDVIGIAVDLDAGTVVFYKNGSSQGTAFTGISGTFVPMVLCNNGASVATNFGQRPFAYTAPSGYKALCTTNLPTPTIGATATTRADDYFNTVLYTGTGSQQTISGVGFQPDFTWIKKRSATGSHVLIDAVRGGTKQIFSNLTNAEQTDTDITNGFASDGFIVGANSGAGTGSTNENTDTYVGWNWKANGAGSSNTNGTITSTVSVNSTSKFSIVKYTGNGSKTATVGHGLGAEPGLILQYELGGGDWWHVWTTGLSGNSYNLFLNATNAERSNEADGQLKNNGSTTFGFDSTTSNVDAVNQNGVNYIAYCFAPVAGFSAFGKYTGNGSIPGPFVYTGFRPAWVLIKRATNAGMDWVIYDNKRTTENVMNDWMYPNLSNSEQLNDSYNHLDFVSNGFKVAPSGSVGNYNNTNGETFIYAAFAEHPFKYSLAR